MPEKAQSLALDAADAAPLIDPSNAVSPGEKTYALAPDAAITLPRKSQGLTPRETSRAISFARIVLIIGLVFIHYDTFPNVDISPFYGLDTHAHRFATWLESSILFFFFSVVPLLSMVSGWLFFSFTPEKAWSAIRRRMWRRFISLYMPLVAWNALYFAGIYIFFAYHPDHPFMSNLEFHFPIERKLDFINAIFGITHRPIAFQFWFVRDLFVTALVSPIFWLMIRYVPWLGILALGAGWLAHSHMGIFWRPDVPFFFYLGALVQQRKINLTIPLRTTIILVCVYLLLVCLRPFATYFVDFSNDHQRYLADIPTSLMRLIGVLACWGVIYRLAQTRWGIVIGGYGGLAFFLHSAHWPLLVVLKMWLWPLMPGDSDLWMLAHYILCVSITVVTGVGLGVLLSRKAPRIFALMNGGRDLGQTAS